MKRFLVVAVTSLLIVVFHSCKDMSQYEGKTRILQDSISHIFPTYEALHIDVNDDYTNIIVVLGDKKFYTASQELKGKKADELGRMILRIYGKGNDLKKGMLVVTMDTRNTSNTPADGIKTPINLEQLNKEVFPN